MADGWKAINGTDAHTEIKNLVEANKTIPEVVLKEIEKKESFEGGYRRAYLVNDRVVLKICKRANTITTYADGIRYSVAQSINEGIIYKKMGGLLPLAKCKVFSVEGFIVTLMERVNKIKEEEIPIEVQEEFSAKKGILDNDALRQCGINQYGDIVCYDYGVEDAVSFDETELVKFIKNLPPFTADSIKEFQNSLLPDSVQTSLTF